MGTTTVLTPHALLCFGIARRDVTPPVGIFHRFWGAATHDVASGVHRPIRCMATAFGQHEDKRALALVLVTIDLCLLRPDDMEWLRKTVMQRADLSSDCPLVFSYGHTHAGGHVCQHRADQPGGELIGPYLDVLAEQTAETIREAIDGMTPARATFASTTCAMGAHRDFQDPADGRYVCGYNPDQPMELPVQVVRFRADDGTELGAIVTYPCHPTTLAWENTLISPDYPGALRETVESESGAACQFLLAPCGDIGPRHGFVGAPRVADDNGRQVGHAAMAAWHSLTGVEGDFVYQGAVLSGATLGEWRFRGWGARDNSTLVHQRFTVDLPYRTDLRQPDVVHSEIVDWESQSQEPAEGQPGRAGVARAMAERCRREWERLSPLPPGDVYPLRVDLVRLGDAHLVLLEGEPYYQLMPDLQAAFPAATILVGVLSEGSRCSYLPTKESYELPLYQVDVSLLASGCLERLRDAVILRIQEAR